MSCVYADGTGLEPGALVPGITVTPGGVPIINVAIPLSVAISLKRIADALSPASEVLTRPVPPPPCGHPAGSAECDECLPF